MQFDQNIIKIVKSEFPEKPNGMKLKKWLKEHSDVEHYVYSLLEQYESFVCIGNVWHCIFNNIDVDTLICKHCKKPTKMTTTNIIREYCSCKCAANSEEKKKHNKETIAKDKDYYSKRQKKIEETNLKLYGVKAPAMCDKIKQKMKDTHSKDPDIWKKRNEKLTKTLSKKYGVSNAYNIKRIQDKSLRTKWNDAYDRFELFKNLVIPNFTKDQFVGRNAKEYSWKCVVCGHDFNQWIKKSYLNDKIYNIPVCPKCHPYKHDSSIGEIELINFCKDVDNTIEIRNNKLIKPYSLDIVSNTSKVALEFNGLYWHCDKANRDQNYHINKINMCHNIGYDLFQVFENGWYDKQNIIKNYILKLFNKLRTIELSYSDCIHCSVDDNVIISFLKNNFYYSDFVINHMYENYCLLDSNNNVLSIMVIDKNYNIICHCDQLNNIYLNSFEYLYHDVITKHNNCNLKYIVNKNWITLNDITQLNNIFKHNLNTEPILYWTRGVTVINLNDINIVDLLKDKFNPQLSENENMYLNGWNKIYDCGNMVFVK